MNAPPAISVRDVSKTYRIWNAPAARIKGLGWQLLLRVLPAGSRLARWAGRHEAALYRDFHALSPLSLEVARGEAVGIVGRNGSGKSTLLQLIAGTLHPTGGTVEVRGRVAALLELGSGFDPEFTGRENVYLNASILGLSRPQIEARFADIVAFADIGDFLDQPIKTYSSGMVMRLAFAVIAHVDADILIVDEALAVGDFFFVQKCLRWLATFMEHGTLLLVSHEGATVTRLCQRALWLDHGAARMIATSKVVYEHYLEAYHESLTGRALPRREPAPGAAAEAPPPEPGAAQELGYDQRRQFLNHGGHLNEIRVFAFNPGARDFGYGRAEIIRTELLDESGRKLSHAVGGETVCILVQARCREDLSDLILGFTVKNKLGQILFADNTCPLTYREQRPLAARAGQVVEARFTFAMPIMPWGQYSISPAVATGTLEQHAQEHWIHDALLFESHNPHGHLGLLGLPVHLSARILE